MLESPTPELSKPARIRRTFRNSLKTPQRATTNNIPNTGDGESQCSQEYHNDYNNSGTDANEKLSLIHI
eukprot:3119386-Alexandrium_andersonii.AAC.1